MLYCDQCGASNWPEAKHCRACGVVLSRAPDQDSTAGVVKVGSKARPGQRRVSRAMITLGVLMCIVPVVWVAWASGALSSLISPQPQIRFDVRVAGTTSPTPTISMTRQAVAASVPSATAIPTPTAEVTTPTAEPPTATATPTPPPPTATMRPHTATSPPASSSVAPRDQPGPPDPVVFVSPATGSVGTAFVFEGRNFPPGTLVTWSASSPTTGATGGTIALDAGQGRFLFRFTTEGWPGGLYTATFRYAASGSVTGSLPAGAVSFAVTTPAATRFKSGLIADIDTVVLALLDTIARCPGANQYLCGVQYNNSASSYLELARRMRNMDDAEVPRQCWELLGQVMRPLSSGNSVLYPGGLPSSASGGEAVRRSNEARQWLEVAKSMVVTQPGNCQ